MSAVTKIIAGVVLIVAGILLLPYIGPVFSNMLISLGLSLVIGGAVQLFQKNTTTTPEAGKINVRISEPLRWINGGRNRQGGAVLFAEFDTSGNLWVLVVHSDSILTGTVKYYLDDTEIILDGAGNVTTNDFCLTSKKEPYTGTGTRVPYFQIWTTTYSESDPTPPPIAALGAAFAEWTSDHKLVGTTYSVMKCKALKIEDRYKIYKWRGALGMGEPAISIVGEWSNMFDPRDVDQLANDPTTHLFSRNAVLVWAWYRLHRWGRNKAISSINWDKVAEQADICDQNVTGITGDQPRYLCDIAVPDDKQRVAGEQEILMTMDAQLIFDDDGKCWPRVGYYQAPTIVLTRNRDIVAMESVELSNIESDIQGVVVRYTDPDSNYSAQPAAAWYHPDLYVPGEAANFASVDILAIQNHNQAMRVAKAIGLRSQPAHSLAPTVGMRGLKVRQERIVNLNYDNTFAGDYEVFTPVELDQSGAFCAFGLVPVDADRWSLLAGEERTKANMSDALVTPSPGSPTGVAIGFSSNRIDATFDAPARDDVTYEFQYIPTADLASDTWFSMQVDMIGLHAYTDAINTNVDYTARYRSVSIAGNPSDWSAGTAVAAVPNEILETVYDGGNALTEITP